MITSDINSLYDNINKLDANEAFEYATKNLLPLGYIDEEMHDLWYKASDYMFENAYFKFHDEIYRIENSEIQGTNSGGDCCSLVLNVNEETRCQ